MRSEGATKGLKVYKICIDSTYGTSNCFRLMQSYCLPFVYKSSYDAYGRTRQFLNKMKDEPWQQVKPPASHCGYQVLRAYY